jgi:glyoxylase-like metal-dependent hydrolase (beta-lactamase superfamily II)
MNVYLVRDEASGGVVVFDAGEKGMAAAIVAAARDLGGISRVVLGHGDTDHRGAAPALRAYADVFCHPDAVPHAQGSGGRDYWRPAELPPDVRLVHGLLHRFVWDGGPVEIDGTVAEGDAIAGFEVVELAGHAPGLIGLSGRAAALPSVEARDRHGSFAIRPLAAHQVALATSMDLLRSTAGRLIELPVSRVFGAFSGVDAV